MFGGVLTLEDGTGNVGVEIRVELAARVSLGGIRARVGICGLGFWGVLTLDGTGNVGLEIRVELAARVSLGGIRARVGICGLGFWGVLTLDDGTGNVGLEIRVELAARVSFGGIRALISGSSCSWRCEWLIRRARSVSETNSSYALFRRHVV